jgi:low affinity Fe/Cu permease
MTPSDIQQLLALPITGVLIFLLIRAEARMDKIIDELIQQTKQSAQDLLTVSGKTSLRFRSTDKIDPAVLDEIQKRVN